MRIIIFGCGKIGKTIIESLVDEGHNIVAVDRSKSVVDEVTTMYDVMGLCGNGVDSDTMEEAGVEDAELFIAVTGSDELNMLACFLAKKMGAKYTLARIRNPEYNDESLGIMKQHLDLSVALTPDKLVAKEIYDKGIRFTPEAQREINTLTEALREILTNTIAVYETPDEAAAANIEPLEQVIDNLTMAIKANHVKRLQKGVCTIETGFVLVDLLTNYERVSDHCSNIAVIMIETAHNAFDTHKYLSKVRFSNQNFIDHYEHFNAKYSISE
jgi:phosphate:Na+ symporter